MAEKNAMLVMRDVSKTFNPGTVNEKCALKNLNLTLKQGEFATIVGSNGAVPCSYSPGSMRHASPQPAEISCGNGISLPGIFCS